MDMVIVRCMLSYSEMVSEEVFVEGPERYVVALDGYYEHHLDKNYIEIPLLRIELFNIFPFMHIRPNRLKRYCRNREFYIKMEKCERKEANAGIFSYFDYDSESYSYYRILDFRWISKSNPSPLMKHISSLGNELKKIHNKTKFRYHKLTLNNFIKSSSFSLVAEPIGQGNLTTLNNDSNVAKMCIDVGHGIPIGRNEIQRGTYVFNDKLSAVESILLTHWDEDHYKLALDRKFSYLLDKFWYVPFCRDEIDNFDPNRALRYEHRLSVWETLLKIMRNNKFHLIEHGSRGVIKLGANKEIKYFCGKKNLDSNDRGVTYNVVNSDKKNFSDILVCGDVKYSLLDESLIKKYTSIIVSHHGAKTVSLNDHPLPYDSSSKAVFSFGFNDRYKHPSLCAVNKATDLKFKVHTTSYINWFSLGLQRSDKLAFYNKHANRIGLK